MATKRTAARATSKRKGSAPLPLPKGRRSKRVTAAETPVDSGQPISRRMEEMTRPPKTLVAGAGGFSTQMGSERPLLGALGSLKRDRAPSRPRSKARPAHRTQRSPQPRPG